MSTKRIAVLFVIMFFSFGLYKGWRISRTQDQSIPENRLKVLLLDASIPSQLIQSFAQKSGYPLDLVNVSNNDEILVKMKETHFDLVTIDGSLLKPLENSKSLLPLEPEFTTKLTHLSNDLMFFDPQLEFSLPLLWKIQESNHKKKIWVLHIAIPQNVKNLKGAKELLTFLSSPPIMAIMTRESKLASTSMAIDADDSFTDEQKPSYLRKLNLVEIEPY